MYSHLHNQTPCSGNLKSTVKVAKRDVNTNLVFSICYITDTEKINMIWTSFINYLDWQLPILLYWKCHDASITHCWHISKNLLQKWPFLSVMQSHLIKMYIYHTRCLMFKQSSWAKLKWVVLRLLSCKFCCFNYWNQYKITDFMSKMISTKVWLNLAKSSIYLFKDA